MSGPLPAVAKAVRLDTHFSQGAAANLQIREFFTYSGTLSTADAVTWLGQMQAAMVTFVGALSETLALGLMELTDLTSSSAPQVQNDTGGVGGEPAAENPAGTALVIKKRITRRYRGGHPRVYIPGTLQGWLVSPDRWSSSAAGVLTGDYVTFINACVDPTGLSALGTITHVNISYFHNFTVVVNPITGRARNVPTPRATPLIDPIVNMTPNLSVASQRRRNAQGS